MQFIFRKAQPADAPAMACLITAAWQTAYRGILSDALLAGIDVEARAQRIEEAIETRPDLRYFVLETDGGVAGVSMLSPCRDEDLPDAMEIVVFYVRPDLQGRGVGRAMMGETLRAAADTGRPSVSLWVLRENARARGFYEAMGFLEDGAEKALPELENVHTVRYRKVEDAHDGFHGTPV